jgi:hypothetical protein
MLQRISAPRFGALVVIFEPSQKQETPEVVYDTFELGPYESRDMQFPTATAAYRFENLLSRDEAGERFERAPDQEPRSSTPDFKEEMDRGKEAQKNYESNLSKEEKSLIAGRREVSKETMDAERERIEKQQKRQAEHDKKPAGQAPKKMAKKAGKASKASAGKKKRYGGRPASPEENEAEQIKAASNPMTSPDPEMRGTTGKKPEELQDAAGRKAGDNQSKETAKEAQNAEDAKQQGRSRS